MAVRRIFRADNPAMFACNRKTRKTFPSDTILTVKMLKTKTFKNNIDHWLQ